MARAHPGRVHHGAMTEQPTPEHPHGFTIGVYLPPEATQDDIEAILTGVSDVAHNHTGAWDPNVVGHAGDWLYVDHHPDQVPDYAAHVRATWPGEQRP